MTTNLKTTELVDAAIALIAGASLTWSPSAPKIVQEGDLAFYVEGSDPDLDVPAVFVKATRVRVAFPDVTGARVDTATAMRIVIVNSWTDGDEVVDKRTAEAEGVAQLFIGATPARFDIGGASVAGYTIVRAVPVDLDLEPPESALVSLLGDRQLYATAIVVNVTGYSERA